MYRRGWLDASIRREECAIVPAPRDASCVCEIDLGQSYVCLSNPIVKYERFEQAACQLEAAYGVKLTGRSFFF